MMKCRLPDEHVGEDPNDCMICFDRRGDGTSEAGIFVTCKKQDCTGIYTKISDRCVMCNCANAKKWGRAY